MQCVILSSTVEHRSELRVPMDPQRLRRSGLTRRAIYALLRALWRLGCSSGKALPTNPPVRGTHSKVASAQGIPTRIRISQRQNRRLCHCCTTKTSPTRSRLVGYAAGGPRRPPASGCGETPSLLYLGVFRSFRLGPRHSQSLCGSSPRKSYSKAVQSTKNCAPLLRTPDLGWHPCAIPAHRHREFG